MGRVEDHVPEAKNASILQHFSHPHPLEEEVFNPQNLPQGLLCLGCKLPPSGTMYVCRPCNFSLHEKCAKLPQWITHPSHPIHTLTLFPVSSYPGGVFSCDACNYQGDGFSFHCQTCDFDLHVLCAMKPLRIKHQMHPCQVDLTFVNPYGNNKGFVCDVCTKMGSKQWLYRCNKCSFDVHLDCAYATRQPQHFSSFPGTGHPQNQFLNPAGSANMGFPNQQFQHGNQLMSSASTGALMANYQPTTGNQVMQNYKPPVGTPIMHSASTGSMPNYQYQQPTVQVNQASMANNFMAAAMQGVVEGAAQAVGQNLVQSFMGGGDGGGGEGGGGDGGFGGGGDGGGGDAPLT